MILADGYLLHPLGYCAGNAHQVMLCRGYNVWSGVISDFGEITLLVAGSLSDLRGLQASSLWALLAAVASRRPRRPAGRASGDASVVSLAP